MPFLFGLFFNPRPAPLFPATNLFLVALQRTADGTLRRPAQLAQDAPSLHGGKLDPAFALNQVSHAPCGP
jgi:hypothetical protein